MATVASLKRNALRQQRAVEETEQSIKDLQNRDPSDVINYLISREEVKLKRQRTNLDSTLAHILILETPDPRQLEIQNAQEAPSSSPEASKTPKRSKTI